jgi:hypothetical protein
VFVDIRTLFVGVVAGGTFVVVVGTSDDNDEKVDCAAVTLHQKALSWIGLKWIKMPIILDCSDWIVSTCRS